MLNELRQLTGEEDERLLHLLLLRSRNIVLAETNRTNINSVLESVVLEVALYLYNKQGSEGEQSRSEGGISVTYKDDLPFHIKNTLSNYRLARVCGNAFEEEQIEDI